METRTLGELRAADADMVYSLYFPDGGRVAAAAAVGCVCLDYLTCSECERILGQSFLAIELAVRKKQRTDHPVPVARVELAVRKKQPADPPVPVAHVEAGSGQGFEPGLQRAEGSDAAFSGTVDRLGRGSPDGVDRSAAAISGMADRLVPGSHPPSDTAWVDGSYTATPSRAYRLVPGSSGGVEGFEATISGMAARLGLPAAVGERAEEVFRKMEEARAWPHHRPGRAKDRCCKVPLLYAACLSVACRNEGTERSLRELSLAAGDGGAPSKREIGKMIAQIRRKLGKKEAGQATGIGMLSVSGYLRRFGALISWMGKAEEAAALEAARRLEDGALDLRHNPESVAAAVVCMALERAGAREPAKDVAAATGVSSMTICVVGNKLRPHAELLFG